jgi:hypothetical protein
MFWLEELNETGFDIIPAFLVDLEEVQTVPPGLDSSLNDAH